MIRASATLCGCQRPELVCGASGAAFRAYVDPSGRAAVLLGSKDLDQRCATCPARPLT
ncbi:hypothetical protein Acf1_00009 [Acidovorax phage ACF1]|nr:hypothetical protein Acf1_00009 [Acidovorax phage ACF1]